MPKAKPKFKKVAERDIQSLMIDWLKIAGYCHRRIPLGPRLVSRNGKQFWTKNPLKGMPDLMIILKRRPGVLALCEVKTDNGVASKDQLDVHEEFRAAGVEVIVCRTLSDMINWLRRIDVESA